MDGQRAAAHGILRDPESGGLAKDKEIWRYLQTSDHFYYMASKYGTSGEVHNYFSHHEAEDAFRTYMAILPILRNVTYGRRRTKNRQRPSGH